MCLAAPRRNHKKEKRFASKVPSERLVNLIDYCFPFGSNKAATKPSITFPLQQWHRSGVCARAFQSRTEAPSTVACVTADEEMNDRPGSGSDCSAKHAITQIKRTKNSLFALWQPHALAAFRTIALLSTRNYCWNSSACRWRRCDTVPSTGRRVTVN